MRKLDKYSENLIKSIRHHMYLACTWAQTGVWSSAWLFVKSPRGISHAMASMSSSVSINNQKLRKGIRASEVASSYGS